MPRRIGWRGVTAVVATLAALSLACVCLNPMRLLDGAGDARWSEYDPDPGLELPLRNVRTRLEMSLEDGSDRDWIEGELANAVATASAGTFEYIDVRRFECGDRAAHVPVYRHVDTGLEFSLIPGGDVRVGIWVALARPQDLDALRKRRNSPARIETLPAALLVSRTEVSRRVWEGGRHRSGARAEVDHPACNMTLTEAVSWTRARGVDLPTESEWEYVARGGAQSAFCWGEATTLEPRLLDALLTPRPVSDGLTNAFGLVGVHEGVVEYVLDPFLPEWNGFPVGTDPVPMSKGGSDTLSVALAPIYRRHALRVDKPERMRGQRVGVRPVVRISEALE